MFIYTRIATAGEVLPKVMKFSLLNNVFYNDQAFSRLFVKSMYLGIPSIMRFLRVDSQEATLEHLAHEDQSLLHVQGEHRNKIDRKGQWIDVAKHLNKKPREKGK